MDWLCAESVDIRRTLVIRFGGGYQVGHTASLNGFRHTFSNFTVGTLRGVPGWYAPGTVVFPPAMVRERALLSNFVPRLYLHPLVQVAVPWDIAWNRIFERRQRHGSCGVGYGAAVERGLCGVVLSVKDLSNEFVLNGKLAGIRTYYEERLKRLGDDALYREWAEEIKEIDERLFIEACDAARPLFRTATFFDLRKDFDHLIFEGNQGILLDAEEGIYPHVSRSFSTSRRALDLLMNFNEERFLAADIYYVTRCYQTRHGEGPMSRSTPPLLVNAKSETNVDNPWQGPLRTGELDPALLDWSLATDAAHQEPFQWKTGKPPRLHLVITCLDQRPDFEIDALISRFGSRFTSVWGSYSPDSKDFKRLV